MSRIAAILLAAALAPLLGGCLGTPTRGVLLPNALRGARVFYDGEPVEEVRHDVEAVVPIEEGVHTVRVETRGAAAIVQRTRVIVNAALAERTGENAVLANISGGMGYRAILVYPSAPFTDPIGNLEPTWQAPRSGEGVVLLASETGTAVAIDGRPVAGALPSKPGRVRDPYPTSGTTVKLAPGKHRLEFSKPGFEALPVEVDVKKGEYAVIGATLARAEKQEGGGS
ncbi:MAG TPA: hypothetical protein VHF22_14385 [Planctomycetota bacterium]|nr:hypothetical protein [Planctomycetota bacterium]